MEFEPNLESQITVDFCDVSRATGFDTNSSNRAIRFQQFDHGLAHGFANVHVGLCISTVVTVGGAPLRKRIGVNGGNLSFEFLVLAEFPIDGELRCEDCSFVTGGAFRGLTKSGTNELGVGGIEVLSQLFDQMNEVLLIATGMARVVAILVALPEKEARNLVLLCAWVILA